VTEWDEPQVEPERSIASTAVMLTACAAIWAIYLPAFLLMPRALPANRVGKLAGLRADQVHNGAIK
jgi:hypothetical protein